MVKIALCDDDQLFLVRFHKLVTARFEVNNCEIQADIFYEGKSLIHMMEKDDKYYDIVFLDINMPDFDGFYLAEKLRVIDQNFCLIFTTQLSEIPKQAFKYNVFRYLDKGNLDEEINEAIDAYISKSAVVNPDSNVISITYIYRNAKKTKEINKNDIIYLEVVRRRVMMYAVYGDYILQTYPLTKYQEILGDSFIIVSRKYCINLAHVIDLVGDFFLLSNNQTICIGVLDRAKNKAMIQYGKYRSLRG